MCVEATTSIVLFDRISSTRGRKKVFYVPSLPTTNTYDIVDVLARANVDFCNSNCFKGGRKQAVKYKGGTYKTLFLSLALNFLSNRTLMASKHKYTLAELEQRTG